MKRSKSKAKKKEDSSAAATDGLPPRPRRPLSSFNLYFRFKRQRLLDAVSSSGGELTPDDVQRVVATEPGLEGLPATATKDLDAAALDELKRTHIRAVMKDKILPRNGRERPHRAEASPLQGVVGFVELGRLMTSSWKECDDSTRAIFDEMSAEGRNHYHERMGEYNDAVALQKKTTKGSDKSTIAKGSAKEEEEDDASVNSDNSVSVENETAERMPQKNEGPVAAPKGDAANTDASEPHKGKRSRVQALPAEGQLSSGSDIQYRPPASEAEERLRSRIHELEAELATERLRMRVRALEDELARRQTIENRLRVELAVERSRTAVAAAAGGRAASMPDALRSYLGAGTMGMPPLPTAGGPALASILEASQIWHVPRQNPARAEPVALSPQSPTDDGTEGPGSGGPRKKPRTG